MTLRTGPADFRVVDSERSRLRGFHPPPGAGPARRRGRSPGRVPGAGGGEPAADAHRPCGGLAVPGGAQSHHRPLSQEEARELQRDFAGSGEDEAAPSGTSYRRPTPAPEPPRAASFWKSSRSPSTSCRGPAGGVRGPRDRRAGLREISEETGVGVNTLLSRKRYAVLRLRERLRAPYTKTSQMSPRSRMRMSRGKKLMFLAIGASSRFWSWLESAGAWSVLLWNWLMPALSSRPLTVTFWQAFGLPRPVPDSLRRPRTPTPSQAHTPSHGRRLGWPRRSRNVSKGDARSLRPRFRPGPGPEGVWLAQSFADPQPSPPGRVAENGSINGSGR